MHNITNKTYRHMYTNERPHKYTHKYAFIESYIHKHAKTETHLMVDTCNYKQE